MQYNWDIFDATKSVLFGTDLLFRSQTIIDGGIMTTGLLKKTEHPQSNPIYCNAFGLNTTIFTTIRITFLSI